MWEKRGFVPKFRVQYEQHKATLQLKNNKNFKN